MKKMIAVLLLLAVTVSSAACGENESNNHDKKSSEKLNDTKITEAIIIDESDLTVTLSGIDFNDYDDLEIGVIVENKSEDITYAVISDNSMINGVDVFGYAHINVEPGETIEDVFEISSGVFDKFGLFDYTDIELSMYAQNTDTLEIIYEETANLYPEGSKKAHSFKKNDAYLEDVLFSNKYLKAYLLEYDGETAYILLENKYSEAISVYFDDSYVNGEESDAYLSETVSADSFMAAEMEIDAENISELTFDLMIESYEEGDELLSETITYGFE